MRTDLAGVDVRGRVIGALLLAAGMMLQSTASFAQIGVSIRIAPPELPVYEQPMCPGDGYIWTPGYWGWANDDYYWAPGTWVMPPEVGYLWTPGYWGWGGSGFMFNDGYWGASVGFYGGIDYGFGYFGNGYEGGRWENGRFFYNTSLNRVDSNVFRNTYNTRVDERVNRVSFNGGNGGINARATAQEEATARGSHTPAVAAQTQHAWSARNDPQQRYASNHGAPPVTATARASAASHPKELAPVDRPSAPNTGNKKQDQKYQNEQNKVVAKQTQDRQNLQQKQDREHQQLAKQKVDPIKTQQLEQQHQQQTRQMQQTHTQQTQQMQQRQQPTGGGGSRGGGRR
jgi:WXXGXW repeat (2 copies)